MQTSTVSSNTNKKSKGSKNLFPLLISIVAGEIITLVFLAVFSIFAMHTDSDGAMTFFAIVSAVAGAAVGGYLAGMAYRKEKFFMGLVCGICMCLILLVLNLLFFREPLAAWSFVKYLLMIAAAAGMTFLVKAGRKRKIRR